jgi:hypothetical protein
VLGYEMVKDIIFWRSLARDPPPPRGGTAAATPNDWRRMRFPGARIIGACEAFDVITSKNSYKSPPLRNGTSGNGRARGNPVRPGSWRR